MYLNPDYERPAADPSMVHELVNAIADALDRTVIPDVTTTADILSALFTSLDHALRFARVDMSEEEGIINSQEINRVLMDFLIEFGDIKAN